MQQTYLDECLERFVYSPKQYLVWEIEDIADDVLASSPAEKVLSITRNTFARICRAVDGLVVDYGLK